MLDQETGTTLEPTPPGCSDPFREASPLRPPAPTPSAAPLLAVCVNPKTFLERFRAASHFAARRCQVPILATVQVEVTP
jgi:hypothetical protein